MQTTSRLGCFTTTGIIAALVTMVVIAGAAFTQGGVLYSPGPLNAQSGETLGGVTSHAETGGECKACHVAPWGVMTMTDRCAACHLNVAAQMREVASLHGVMTHKNPNLKCGHCHPDHRGPDAPLTVATGADFPHEELGYSLNGHQLTVTREAFLCSDCHAGDITTFDPAVCADCHRQMDLAFTTAHELGWGGNCLSCHDGVDTYGNDFNHNNFVFPLIGKHVEVSCYACHTDARSVADMQAARQDCAACHLSQDEHAGRFGADCGVCHSAEGWTPAKFDHTLSVFKLEGEHTEVACEDCHKNNVYQGTPTDCYSCHAQDDEHNGEFGKDCTACHKPQTWDDAKVDHNLFAFKLEGEHANVRCENCHQNGVFKGTPLDCYSCHRQDDEHGGKFGIDCAACHTPSDWDNATFDHSRSAFPLTGAHQQIDCEQCHVNSQFAGTPSACVNCHADPAYHAGAFGTDCASCHSTTAWSPAMFNGQHTFPLNHGESGNVSCATCHPSSFTTYTCYGCHEHSEADIRSEHLDEGISNYQNCMECHPDGREGGD